MRNAAFALGIAMFTLMGSAIWSADNPQPATDHPACRFVNATDPAVSAQLANRTLVAAGVPSTTRTTHGELTTKVSRREFKAYDEHGNVIPAAVTCVLACQGNACTNSGCIPNDAGTGCTAFTCGTNCTGVCTQQTQVGVGEIQ
jgi:hypothetical protein